MSCEKFLEWLDEGNSVGSVDELPEEFFSHVTDCASCQNFLALQNSAIVQIRSSAVLKRDVKNRIFSKLETQINAAKSEKISFIDQLLSGLLITENRKWLYSGISFLLILVFLTFYNSSAPDNPRVNAFASGNGIITRNLREIQLSAGKLQLLAGDKLKCLSGKSKIAWDHEDQIEIEGQAEFLIGENRLQMLNGKTRLSFTSSAKGYVIEMKEALLTIVGTVIRLEIAPDNDSIFVEKGKIQWQQLKLAKSGILAAGQGICISAASVEEIKPGKIPAPKELPIDPEANTISEPVLPK
ncbi:MAG: hypothetical protein KKB51_18105 [Candidatus Riflebacteria bacterium]|nr:hypothetical protein [Candidatus Riflebacteria bacterium]